MKGQKHILDLTSDVPLSVHIDATYLSDPSSSVPMLAANFGLYDKYFVHNVSLEFIPNQPVTVGGTVGMAPDYDPLDPMPLTRSELSSSFGYVSGAVTQPLKCHMPNFKGPDNEFVRGSLYCAPVSDDRLNSFGQFKVFGEGTGLTKGDSIGRLVLHYEITFFLPEPQHTDLAGTEDSVVTQLVSVGSSFHHRCNEIVSTTNSDVIQLTNSGGTPVAAIPDYLYTGIIDTANSLMAMYTATGRVINEGTRVFFKPAQQSVATTTMADLASTYIVGAFNLARNFAKATEIITALTNTEAIGLRNVRRWNAV